MPRFVPLAPRVSENEAPTSWSGSAVMRRTLMNMNSCATPVQGASLSVLALKGSTIGIGLILTTSMTPTGSSGCLLISHIVGSGKWLELE